MIYDDLDLIAVHLQERARHTSASMRACRDWYQRPDIAKMYCEHSAALYLEARIARDYPSDARIVNVPIPHLTRVK